MPQPVAEQQQCGDGMASCLSQKYTCNTCGVRFAWLSNLRRHEHKHVEERIFLTAGDSTETTRWHFQCSYCGRVFAQADSLRKHIVRHVEPAESPRPLFTCRLCGQRFLWKQSLGRHLRNAHSSPSSAQQIPLVTTASMLGQSLSARARSSSSVQSGGIDLAGSQDNCDNMDQLGLSSGKEHVNHQVPPDSDASVDVLKGGAGAGPSLNRNNRPLVPCPQCGFAFFWRCNLLRHIHQQHEGKPPTGRDRNCEPKHLQCSRCGRRFSRLRHLRVHLQVTCV